MLTLWHVGVSCLVLVVVVCVCPLLASRPVVSECGSVGGVGGVARASFALSVFCSERLLLERLLLVSIFRREGGVSQSN